MTDIATVRPAAVVPPTRVPRRVASPPWPILLYAGVAIAGVAGFVLGHKAGTGGMDVHLAALLRFMAVVKGGMALGALALVQWRLQRPASDRLVLGYGFALALMAAAPGLIWGLAVIGTGAALFHAGLIAFIVLAWRDDAVPLRG